MGILWATSGIPGLPAEPGFMMLIGVLTFAPSFLATVYMMRRADPQPWSWAALGREAARPVTVIGGLLIGAVTIALPIGLLIAIGWVAFTKSVPGDPIMAGLVLALFFAPAALAEELLLRGYAFAALRERWSPSIAIGFTSLVFGILHAGNPGANGLSIALVTLAGIFLGVVLVATNSLYAAWAAHFAWNWVMVGVFHANVSGYPFPTPVYRMVSTGPSWATGGRWGPEGGLVAGLAMLLGIGLMYWFARDRFTADYGLRTEATADSGLRTADGAAPKSDDESSDNR